MRGICFSLFCGLLNLGGEFCVVLCFQHALWSKMNQGILTSIFALGSVIVLVGSVILNKETVRLCEYLGTALVVVGTIVLSLAKKGGSDFSEWTVYEGPGLAILFSKNHNT